MKRFYYESEKGMYTRTTHYVIDRYADTGSEQGRTDVNTRREGLKLVRAWNRKAPWPAWDTIQEKRDAGL